MSDNELTNDVDSSCANSDLGELADDRQVRPRKNYVALMLVSLFVLLPALGFLSKAVWSRIETRRRLAETQNSLSSTSETLTTRNGFDLQKLIIPNSEVRRGGPGKDGIPAISDPQYVPVDDADYLTLQEEVIGIEFAGEARAYPLRMMDYHEAVNDTIGGIPVAVTYCPLCASVAVFDRRLDGEVIDFGISGLLYNSNVLLYDRQQSKQESLWSQLMSQSVSESEPGRELKLLPVELTIWSDWKSRHPQGKVLKTKNSNAPELYASYHLDPSRLMFPVTNRDARLPLKERVLGVKTKHSTRAYPISRFHDVQQESEFHEVIDGLKLTLAYDPQSRSLRVTNADEGVEWMYSYWFAWSAFYPETKIHSTKVSPGVTSATPGGAGG